MAGLLQFRVPMMEYAHSVLSPNEHPLDSEFAYKDIHSCVGMCAPLFFAHEAF